MSNVSKLIIISIPDHKLRFAVIRLLSQSGYRFISAKNLPKLCHEITNLEEECLLVIDIFAYSSPLFKALKSFGADKKLKSIFLLDEEGMRHSMRFNDDGTWYGVEKKYLDEQLLLIIDQMYGKQTAQKEESPSNEREVYLMPKKEGSLFNKEIGRRSFLKGSAAAAAVAGVAAASPGNIMVKALAAAENLKSDKSEDQIFYGSCRANCFAGCRLKITVRNGKVVKTQAAENPNPSYNRICAKGLTHVQTLYNSGRLKHPMKRVGERGAGQWEQITWEEAIKTITDQWKKIRSESGNSAIASFPGTGNYGTLAGNGHKRFFGLMGATSIAPNYDSNHLNTLIGALGLGPNFNANDLADLVNAKTILFYGANVTEAQVQNWHFVREAQENGAKLISVDPVSTTLSIKSDIHVPLRPGTDAALTMAMTNLVIKNGWTDDDFIKKYSVGPFLVKEDGTYLRLSDLGKAEKGTPTDAIVVRGQDGSVGLPSEILDPVIKGTFTINDIKVTTAFDLLANRVAEWTPERAAEVCDISVDMINNITRIYATEKPSSMYLGFGPDHYATGDQAYLAMVALGVITGNCGKKGASLGWPANLGFNVAGAAIATVPGAVPGPTIPTVKLPDIVEKKQFGGKPLEIRSIYHVIGNPLGNLPGRTAVLEAYKKMDLIVVADWFITDTARYADILLPAAHWFEQEEICNVEQTDYTAFQDKAVEPHFESKSDWEIFRLLAEAMGFGDKFAYSESDMLKMACATPASAAFGLTYDKLKSEKVLKCAFATTPDKLYVYGGDGKYGTATGRTQFYIENTNPDFSYDPVNQKVDPMKTRLPYFEPPYESWTETVGGFNKNPLAEKYPLIYTSERNKLKTHTMFGHNPWLLELYPEPIVKVNPKDAEKRGIAEGDYAKLYNDRGYVVLKVVYNSGVRPGMVVVPKGWEKDQFKDGHYSDLTSTITSDYRYNSNYYEALCEMKKA